MSNLKRFLRIEDINYNKQYKETRRENARLESYKTMGM
jgi:hypothetical protein